MSCADSSSHRRSKITDDLVVRDALPSDAPVIASFNIALALESENLVLDPQIVHRGVQRVFTNPEYGRYFVASVGDFLDPTNQDLPSAVAKKIVGQTMITYEPSDWRDGMIFWIQSVYVLPEYRGYGIFRRLFTHIQQIAHARGDVRLIRLYVEHQNTQGINTYKSLGMTQTTYQIFELSC